MSFNTFGYNAVFEIRKEVVDKLLAQVYEKNMVETNGVITNDEFITIDDLGNVGGTKVVIYLKIGAPTCNFDPSAKSENIIDLNVPMDIALWQGVNTNTVGNNGIAWSHNVLKIALQIDELALTKETGGNTSTMRPAFKTLTSKQLRFFSGGIEFTDQALDLLLLANKVPFTASDLKAKILEKLKSGALKNIDIQVPSAGSDIKWIENWDFQIISKQKQQLGATYDSIDLLLYESDQAGKGLPSDATNTIPQSASSPYHFALSIRKDVLINKYFEDLLDRKSGYIHQGGSINTPGNPFGYMVVSSSGQTLKYTLPAPPNGQTHTITVSAPVNGKVVMTIPAGGMLPASRAYLHNLDTGTKVDFSADDGGGATVTIDADKNHRLGIQIYALSVPNHSDIRIWRPKFTLLDGKLRLDFHYYYEIPNWCDAEGDGWAEIEINVDRSNIFKLSTKVVDSHVDLPWWAHVLGFLAEILTGGLVNGIAATILVEVLGTKLVSEFVAGQIDKSLQNQLKFPVPGSGKLAIFLEQVNLFQTGVVFTGYADAGLIQHYGRQKVKVAPKGVLLVGSGMEGFSLHFQQGAAGETNVSCYYPTSVFSGVDIPDQFWKADYQQGILSSFGNTTSKVEAGKMTSIWVNHDYGLAKVLLEPDASDNSLYVTWIFYKPWVTPYVKIENNIVATTNSANKMGLIFFFSYKYSGDLKIDARKYLRTALIREAGLEHWKWDGQEIPQDGTLTQPGVSVTWDTKSDCIYVTSDQTQLKPFLPPPPDSITPYVPEHHLVEYKSIDVFGNPLSAKLNLYLPASSTEVTKPLYKIVIFKHEILPDPPWRGRFIEGTDLWASGAINRMENVTSQFDVETTQFVMETLSPLAGNYPYVWKLANTLATALKDGRAQIDSETAEVLLNLIIAETQ